MLAEAFPLGSWKSLMEMEMSLTLEELKLIITEGRNREEREHKFLAAIQGIDLDKQNAERDLFEETKAQVEAELAGKTSEEMFLDFVGIEIEEDGD